MRSEDNKVYRFNLSFIASDDKTREIGDYLEGLGRKKSTIVVAALKEYLDNHNEDAILTAKPNVSVLRKIVREIVEQTVSEMQSDNKLNTNKKISDSPVKNGTETDGKKPDIPVVLTEDNDDDEYSLEGVVNSSENTVMQFLSSVANFTGGDGTDD